MTRFDADTEETRRELFVDAIAAHGERGSPFLTIEAEVETEVRNPRPLTRRRKTNPNPSPGSSSPTAW